MKGKIEPRPVLVDVDKVDWKLLREQKDCLLQVRNYIKKPPVATVIDGIISLLDDIQDQAAVEIGEEKVFGKRKSNG